MEDRVRDDVSLIGPRLRAARQERGWTLDDLATRAGISVSTLSRLESGKRQANLELLVPLTRHLGIRIDDLVAEPPRDPRVRLAAMRRNGLVVTPLTPENAPVRTYKVVFPPRKSVPRLRVHDGYEWLYVLAGRLRLVVGDQDLVLRRGEAAEFDTRIPHALAAHGSAPAEILSIFSDDGVRIHTRTGATSTRGPVSS
jgi:transcriptional regulator with XRE-family HTH domain